MEIRIYILVLFFRIPSTIRGFTNAVAMMIAEKGSDLIKDTYLQEISTNSQNQQTMDSEPISQIVHEDL